METYTLRKPKSEMCEEKLKAFETYYHIPHTPVIDELRNYLTNAGFEEVVLEDCGERWSENCWAKS